MLMRMALSALLLLVVISSHSTRVACRSKVISDQPPITIEEAIAVAKAFVAANKIDVAKHYVDSAKLNQNPRGDRGKYWEIRWEESQPTCKGCYIVVFVFMDRSAERISSK